MRRYHQLIAVVGTICIMAGMFLLVQSPARAQDSPGEPPFLAEFYDMWVGSPHHDLTSAPFTHWDTDGKIPVDCARCHSTEGYRDFLGADGTDAGVVDNEAPTGTGVTCDACHNSVASTLTTVTFPSGAEITDNGNSVRCMVCHQGRASGQTVDDAIAKLDLTDSPNTPSPDLKFVNIHYYAAAATLYGSDAQGGYQFPDLRYQMKNQHVPGYDTCTGCHNPHTLEIKVDECSACHDDVKTKDDLQYIRMPGSSSDYDGDGDTLEGIAQEIQGLQEMTYQAIQSYAVSVAGTAIVYNQDTYPYFFIDTNGNGELDTDEAVASNGYNAFTPNLLKAVYNYQVTIKDPGGFAHNPTYMIELLYDSISMLNQQMPDGDQVDLSTAKRTDPGHFDVTAEPFRHWDADGVIPGTCARCHSATGLPTFIENGVNINVSPPTNSLTCSTCHDNIGDFTTYTVDKVPFPSGAVLSFGDGEPSNLCLNCHQGRESTVSVNSAIAKSGAADDEVSSNLNFRNVHYFAAGATLFGSEAQGAYQYDGQDYNGRNMHTEDYQQCIQCHDQHALTVRVDECSDCHDNVDTQDDLKLIRQEAEGVEPIDYNGNGDATEPIADEIASFQDALLAQIQAYAKDKAGTAIAYSPDSYPYYFIDTNGNGQVDPDEANSKNGYASWTPNLLRAAYNYQYMQKDPGVFAHNPDYAMQIMYDSIESLGGADAVASFTRPPVQASS